MVAAGTSISVQPSMLMPSRPIAFAEPVASEPGTPDAVIATRLVIPPAQVGDVLEQPSETILMTRV